MKYVDVSGIKLNHIKIFLAVVEYGSFTIAAEKLYMTQPFISKSISHLEQELGLYLLIRGNGQFQVTPAGKRLYQEWKLMMQNFEKSLTSAHSIQSGMTDELHIGIGALTEDNNIIIQNLKKTKELLVGLEIMVEYNDMASLLDSLVKGLADLIIISKHMLPAVEKWKLEWQTVIKTNLALFVPKSNPLYRKERLDFSDLKQEKFIAFSSENDDNYIRLLYHLAEQAGFVPMISCYVPNEMSFQANLELGNGIVLADSFSNLETRDIKKFELDIRNDIIAVWKPKNMRECIQTCVSLFENQSGT